MTAENVYHFIILREFCQSLKYFVLVVQLAALYLFFLPFIMMDYEVYGSEYFWLGITVNKLWPVTAW